MWRFSKRGVRPNHLVLKPMVLGIPHFTHFTNPPCNLSHAPSAALSFPGLWEVRRRWHHADTALLRCQELHWGSNLMIFYEFHTIFMALARSLARQRVELIELAELQHMHVRHVQHKSSSSRPWRVRASWQPVSKRMVSSDFPVGNWSWRAGSSSRECPISALQLFPTWEIKSKVLGT